MGGEMQELTQQKCIACRAGAPKVSEAELPELMPKVPDWQIVIKDAIPRLERVFPFSDFAHAMSFSVKVGELAEEEGHHPAILTEWGRVTVSWWTHKIGGLHLNDFIMAAKTDQLLR
jgi:4a-hydroxytetrahydrobiopterin dehydratase